MKSRERLFTIIELLIVIAIMAILAALLLPALGNAKGMAKGMTCSGNLKQQGVATASYTVDYNGWLLTTDSYLTGAACGWKTYLAPYILQKYQPETGILGRWCSQGVFKCPEWDYLTNDVSVNAYYGGYAICYKAAGLTANPDSSPSRRRRIDQITRLSQTILIGDATTNAATSANYYCTQIRPPSWGDEWLLNYPKHRQGFNNLWADFHIDWQPRAYLLQGQPDGKIDGASISAMDYYYHPKTN